MAIALTGTGGIFTRLGLWLGALNESNTFRLTSTGTRVTNLRAQYASADEIVIDDLITTRDSFRSSFGGWLASVRASMQDTVVEQVNRDTALPSKTLVAALTELIRQMRASSDTLTRPTVSVTVTPYASNYGDTKFAASLVDADGGTRYMAIPETLTVTVTGDAGTGSTQYAEPLSVTAPAAVSDGLDYLWPTGSGAATSLTVTNAASTTKVTDGDFESWTTNTPNSWTIGTGTAGTTVLKGTSPKRTSYNLKFVGNGAELTSLYQAVTLLPNKVYALCFWAKKSAGAAAGAVRVRLADGSGTTVADDAATNNQTTVAVGSLTTSYVAQAAFFVTPKVLPSTLRLHVELSTAVTNTETIEVDLVALVEATQAYAGGPWVAAFSGSTQAAKNDYASVAVANNGGRTSFITALDAVFDLRRLGLKFPDASSGTVSNALIT